MTLVYRNLHQSLKLLMWLQLLIASVNGGSDGKASVCNTGDPGFDRWVGKIPWRRKWQPTPVFLPGKSHGPRSLIDYRPWGRKESDTTERLHFLSWWWTPKPLGISWVTGFLFLGGRAWWAPGWWLVTKRPWGERRVGNWVNDWSCPHDDASIKKSPKYGVQRASALLNTSICWEEGVPQLHGGRSSWAWGSSGPHLVLSLHLTVHLYHLSYALLYNKLVNVFPSLLWAALTNPQIQGVGDSWELLICSQVRQSCE